MTQERLWTINASGIPEDFALEGVVDLKGGKVNLDPGASFVDQGRYGELTGGEQGNIHVTLVPQRTGISLSIARIVERVLDKAVTALEKVYGDF